MNRSLSTLALAATLLMAGAAHAEPAKAFGTEQARVTFHADTPMQAIDATTTEGAFTYDANTGAFTAKIPVASFKFQNKQMEQNFQSGHVAVNEPGAKDAAGQPTFPNKFATLTGKLDKTFDTTKEGVNEVSLKGQFAFHGVTKEKAFKGTVTVKGTDLVLNAKFDLAPKDFGVPLPKLGDQELGAMVNIVVDATLSAAKP